MQKLSKGENAPLTAQRFEVVLDWSARAGTLDTSIYLLTQNGAVRGDADMIFYNQRSDASGAVQLKSIEVGHTLALIDLASVPAEIERIAVCVTVEEPGHTIANFAGLAAAVRLNGETLIGFSPDLRGAPEAALRLLEIYRRNGVWKLRADGQGYNAGLAPLARSFGIEVAADEQQPPKPRKEEEPSSAPGRPEQIPVEPVEAANRLSSARPKAEWLMVPGEHLGQITANLSWHSERGGQSGRPRALQLALGCLFELNDGRQGLVQDWDSSGRYDLEPFVQLLPAPEAEGVRKLLINGERLGAIRRLALFAFIPFEAPSWGASTIEFELSAQGRESIRVRVDHGRDGMGMVGLALLSQDDGRITIEHLAGTFPGHQDFAQQLGWNLSWKPAMRTFRVA